VQSILCTGLAGALLFSHFRTVGGVGGGDLLLIYWTLKLPAIGARMARLAQQYPTQRNVLNRMLEPLGAPEAEVGDARHVAEAAPQGSGPLGLELRGGAVLAGGHEILREVDLRIEPGEHVAIVGVSGAGKSSLLGLLLGWHRLSAGSLLLDGTQANAAEIAALRRSTAWVDPAVQIWNRSLLENLEYASDGPDRQRMGQAIQAAELRPVIDKLPKGLQAALGEGGALISGGEGQRVRLARALLTPGVRLVLLDEPFRGLGRDQRRRLLRDARTWWKRATLLCVTHDVGETLGFPRVLVVEDGKIVEDGAPADLAGRASRYRDLLSAEARLAQSVWRASTWRRLSLIDGKVEELGAP
jgi:ATP-binding cassette subfamily B protein